MQLRATRASLYQKRLAREPCGSYATVISATDKATVLDEATVLCRNSSLNKQLSDKHLRSVNVEGDRNCFFWALSLCMVGYQRNHIALRQAAAKYIASCVTCSSSADYVALRKHAADVMKGGTWVGEDVILAMAECLERQMHVFMYVDSNGSSPKIYSLSTDSTKQAPLRIALYEPGHYRSVVDINSTPHLNHLNF